MAEDLTEQTASLKLDLLFGITQSDILDHLSIIMNSNERTQLKSSDSGYMRFLITPLVRWNQ